MLTMNHNCFDNSAQYASKKHLNHINKKQKILICFINLCHFRRNKVTRNGIFLYLNKGWQEQDKSSFQTWFN